MQVAYLLYDRFTALDITGPHDVLNSLPDAESVFVAEQAGPVRNESGSLALVADRKLDEVAHPDVVVVPGGFGTRALLSHRPLLEWLRTAHETSTWTTSVCTGALLLAAAGLLEGAPATTHWFARERLASLEGVSLVHDQPVVRAFAVRLQAPVDRVIERCRAEGVNPGVSLEPLGYDGGLLVAITEQRTAAHIDRLADALGAAVAAEGSAVGAAR